MERESKARGERAGAETKSVCSYLHFIVRGAQITHTVCIMHVTTQKQGRALFQRGSTPAREREMRNDDYTP